VTELLPPPAVLAPNVAWTHALLSLQPVLLRCRRRQSYWRSFVGAGKCWKCWKVLDPLFGLRRTQHTMHRDPTHTSGVISIGWSPASLSWTGEGLLVDLVWPALRARFQRSNISSANERGPLCWGRCSHCTC